MKSVIQGNTKSKVKYLVLMEGIFSSRVHNGIALQQYLRGSEVNEKELKMGNSEGRKRGMGTNTSLKNQGQLLL